MYGLFTRRNMITMLMSLELILNSVNINFVVFNKYLYPDKLDGLFFAILLSPLPRQKLRWRLRLSLIFTAATGRLMWRLPKR